MEVNEAFQGRRIVRSYETNRLEDEVWALAYEEIQPLLRRVLNSKPDGPQDDARSASTVSHSMARSA